MMVVELSRLVMLLNGRVAVDDDEEAPRDRYSGLVQCY